MRRSLPIGALPAAEALASAWARKLGTAWGAGPTVASDLSGVDEPYGTAALPGTDPTGLPAGVPDGSVPLVMPFDHPGTAPTTSVRRSTSDLGPDAGSDRRAAATTQLRRSAANLDAKPLPVAFRAMASAIVGSTPVTVAHGATARAALRAADTKAAAIGRTILLDAAPTDTAAMRERIAHELTHVAHNVASGVTDDGTDPDSRAVPRFFDDPHRDHEERAAERIGRVARSLVAGANSLSPSPSPVPTTSTAGTTSTTRTASIAGRPSAIRRQSAPTSSTPAAGTAAAAPSSGSSSGTSTVIRRTVAAGGSERSGPATRESATERLDRVDELVSLVEARVLAELERRGGRHRGWI